MKLICLSKCFQKIKTASSDKEKDFELAREFKQLWKTVLSAITAIYTRFDDEKCH